MKQLNDDIGMNDKNEYGDGNLDDGMVYAYGNGCVSPCPASVKNNYDGDTKCTSSANDVLEVEHSCCSAVFQVRCVFDGTKGMTDEQHNEDIGFGNLPGVLPELPRVCLYDKISKSYDDGSLSGCLNSVLVCQVENSGNDFAVNDGFWDW